MVNRHWGNSVCGLLAAALAVSCSTQPQLVTQREKGAESYPFRGFVQKLDIIKTLKSRDRNAVSAAIDTISKHTAIEPWVNTHKPYSSQSRELRRVIQALENLPSKELDMLNGEFFTFYFLSSPYYGYDSNVWDEVDRTPETPILPTFK